MKVTECSIDDLHQASLAEFDGDNLAITRLNLLYAETRKQYLASLDVIRKLAAEDGQ